MLGVLVLVALTLITVSVRETNGGALHGAQNAGATVLRPFQVAAERVARPFRDVYGYFSGLASAKSENKKLRSEVDTLRQQLTLNRNGAQEAATLRRMLRYEGGPEFPTDYRPVNTRVVGAPAGPFQQRVVIEAGTNQGVSYQAPVLSPDGVLVGQVTRAAASTSVVTLLTDPDSAVSVVDETTGAIGVLEHGPGDTLSVRYVTKDKQVSTGDMIITSGTQNRLYPDLYPRGIQVGKVAGVSQTNVDFYKQIQVQPFVDFSSLDSLIVLVATKPVPQLP